MEAEPSTLPPIPDDEERDEEDQFLQDADTIEEWLERRAFYR